MSLAEQLVTGSDCEIILHLFALWEGDVGRVALALDGVFGFVICDTAGESPVVYAARDHLGVRPLYIGSSGATSRTIRFLLPLLLMMLLMFAL